MLEFIRNWVLGLAGAAVICAAATELTPKGPVKALVRALCAIVMASALLAPLLDFDFPAYSLSLAKYREGAAAVTEGGAEVSGELNRRVIEERLRAYILDKAQTFGADITDARVTLRWSGEGVWYPAAVELEGNYNGALAADIEAELGVPGAAQTWRNDAEP